MFSAQHLDCLGILFSRTTRVAENRQAPKRGIQYSKLSPIIVSFRRSQFLVTPRILSDLFVFETTALWLVFRLQLSACSMANVDGALPSSFTDAASSSRIRVLAPSNGAFLRCLDSLSFSSSDSTSAVLMCEYRYTLGPSDLQYSACTRRTWGYVISRISRCSLHLSSYSQSSKSHVPCNCPSLWGSQLITPLTPQKPLRMRRCLCDQRRDLLPRHFNRVLAQHKVQRRIRHTRDLVDRLRTPPRVLPGYTSFVPPEAAGMREEEVRVLIRRVLGRPGRAGSQFGADPSWLYDRDLHAYGRPPETRS